MARKSYSDKEREQVKEALLITVLESIVNQGLVHSSIAILCEKVGISKTFFYSFFSSKEELAKFAIQYSTNILAEELKEINQLDVSSKEKIYIFVKRYLENVQNSPEVIEYFLRVYL